MKLTKRIIDAARYEGSKGKWHILWDDHLKGFGLRIYPSGKKSFVLFFRVKGRLRLMTLGAYGVLMVDEAKKLAQTKLAQIIQGEDPLAERQKDVRGPTIKHLCEDYVERYAKPYKKTWKGDQRFIKRYVIPNWGSRKVSQIKKADVAVLHHKIGKTSIYEANHTLSLLSKLFECGKEWGFLDEDASNPARGIRKYKEVKRDRYLSEEEWTRLARAIEGETNIYIRSSLWLLLLTGLRKSELLTAKWEYLDLERRVLRLDKKAGRPFILPLSQEAINVFKKIPKEIEQPYIFSGHLKGQPLVTLQRNFDRIKKEADVTDLRLHDLRRTVSSWIVQKEQNIQFVSRVLNHSDITTTHKIYVHLDQEQIKSALERHGKSVMKLAGKKPLRLIKEG